MEAKSRVTDRSGRPQQRETTPFCAVAEEYDREFTHQRLGESKRRLVHQVISPLLTPGMHILELNGGTGEDALFLSRNGGSLLSTDASEGMIRVAQQKAEALQPTHESPPYPFGGLRFAVATIEEIAAGTSPEVEQELASEGPFDLIFSNFDGINCIEKPEEIAPGLIRLLRPGGHLVLVFMARHTLIEKVRDTLRGDLRRILLGRGHESGRLVSIGSGFSIRTWFPPVGEVLGAFEQAGFRSIERRAIGLFLPPTTMEGFYRRHPRIFSALERLESPASRLPILENCGDHVLLHFVRPEQKNEVLISTENRRDRIDGKEG